MASGEFETERNMRNIVIAVVIVAIIGVSAVVVVLNMPAGETGRTITIVTRHDVAIHAAYEKAFLATEYAIENNIVDLSWKSVDANYWDDLIEAGGIDVLWGGGPTIFDNMQRQGYLEPMTSDVLLAALERVPDEIAGADMKRMNDNNDVVWVAAAISSFGFTVNHAFLDTYTLPTPNNWTHLAQPIWGSILPTATIAMGNAPKTTSNTRIYEIITQGMGWDAGWVTLARMAGSANLYQGSVETQAAAENQEVGVSMSIDFYGYATQANNPDCEYILPQGESIVNGDPIALCAEADDADIAEGFIDWVLSAEGQAVWFTPGVNRMPVLESAFQTEIGQENDLLYNLYNQTLENQGIDFDDDLSLQINTAFTAYFEAVYNDAHDELVACWDDLIDAYYNGDITLAEFNDFATQMGTPVTIEYEDSDEKFTVDFAKDVNDAMYADTNTYYTLQTAWTAAAIAQYGQVQSDLAALIGS